MTNALTRVKNTFIEVVDSSAYDEEDCASLSDNRTQSDPIGRNAGFVHPRRLPPSTTLVSSAVAGSTEAIEEEEIDEEEEDDDIDLCRTESVVGTFKPYDDQIKCDALPVLPENGVAPHPILGAQMPPAICAYPVLIPSMPNPYVWPMASAPPYEARESASEAPPFGALHTFHREVAQFGNTEDDYRSFTKGELFDGRLSVVTENTVRKKGVHRYLVQFAGGDLSRADGIGFVFSSRLPCTKDIQKIVSVYLNQQGEVGMRFFSKTKKCKEYTVPLETGDWIDMEMDLDNSEVQFRVWRAWYDGQLHLASSVNFRFGASLARLNRASGSNVKADMGHLACVVKNVGTSVVLGS